MRGTPPDPVSLLCMVELGSIRSESSLETERYKIPLNQEWERTALELTTIGRRL